VCLKPLRLWFPLEQLLTINLSPHQAHGQSPLGLLQTLWSLLKCGAVAGAVEKPQPLLMHQQVVVVVGLITQELFPHLH
jgi:hypothetical protein